MTEQDVIRQHIELVYGGAAKLCGEPAKLAEIENVWLALVAVTPWGPLVRMEFTLSGREDA